MADRLYRAQVTIPLDSGIPDDAVVNTWHFDDDDDPIAGPEDTQGWILDALTGFYQAIDSVVYPAIVASAATVRMYDMRDAEPRVPRAIETIALTPSANDALPSEVALCLSFAAPYTSGVNPARRRGRIFLGPLNAGVGGMVGSQNRPDLAVRQTIAAAAATLVDGVEHPGSPGLHLKWAIYSPATDAGGATLDDSFFDVTSGWIDDAFDTQRRRGAAPTERTVFS
jgi:hypothetical protein